jgi:fructan beta-fructosidase
MKKFTVVIVLAALIAGCSTVKKATQTSYLEKHRPQFHFSPEAKWMNDPNGMVYYNGIYHMFYQFYPDSTVWGPMHWAHATSKDLVRWEHQPVALYPDSLGYIFSGSAVADINNTSGFGTNGQVPLVAIFTHHNPVLEKGGRKDYQYQSLAYSLDEGKTWTKYSGNPVVKNPGIVDFRDPKVMWFEEGKKWIMTLATKDRVTFYSSPDLKNWSRESDLGKDFGAHGGVWECPDLFPLDYNGKKIWVLLVSINPGGPNGGSATQYFTGDFDGSTFTPHSTETKWIDYGTDNYAGITWSNTGDRKVFLGWMNNWQYAQVVPTETWRGAATLPRELSLQQLNGKYYLSSTPVKELDKITDLFFDKENLTVDKEFDLSDQVKQTGGKFKLNLSLPADDFSIVLFNEDNEELVLGYEKASNQYFIDRTKAGKSDFEPGFAKKHLAPRISASGNIDMTLFVDAASIEVFADNGLNVFTDVFFPGAALNKLKLRSANPKIDQLQLFKVKSIW